MKLHLRFFIDFLDLINVYKRSMGAAEIILREVIIEVWVSFLYELVHIEWLISLKGALTYLNIIQTQTDV